MPWSYHNLVVKRSSQSGLRAPSLTRRQERNPARFSPILLGRIARPVCDTLHGLPSAYSLILFWFEGEYAAVRYGRTTH